MIKNFWKFNGYQGEYTEYGYGDFSVGKTYEIVQDSVMYYEKSGQESDAKFVDNSGRKVYENLKFFSKVPQAVPALEYAGTGKPVYPIDVILMKQNLNRGEIK